MIYLIVFVGKDSLGYVTILRIYMGVLLVIFAGNAVVYLILAAKTMLSIRHAAEHLLV